MESTGARFHFRGGPLDGRYVWVPVNPEQPEWFVATVGGIWLGDRSEPLPEDLSTVDYRHERYVRAGDEYVHETLG